MHIPEDRTWLPNGRKLKTVTYKPPRCMKNEEEEEEDSPFEDIH